MSEKVYIDQLTWLRGFAAYVVVVSHSLRATEVTYLPGQEAAQSWLVSLFDLGSYGVVLFFALSGCTLYISNNNLNPSGRDVAGFYIKRFFRIWPAFAVSILVYLAFRPVFAAFYGGPQDHWIEGQFLIDFDFSDLLAYFTLTFNITGPSSIINNAYWSLPVEFQYYLIFPLLMISLRYLGIMGPALIGAVIFLLPKFGLVEFDRNIVFTLAFSFCGGVIVGHLYKIWPQRFNWIVGGALLLFCFAVCSFVSKKVISLPSYPVLNDKWVWYGVFGVVSVFAVLNTEYKIGGWFERFLERFGTISYSTYLYHNVVIAALVLLMPVLGITSGNMRLWFCLGGASILTYYLAALSYDYVEKPSIRLGHKVIDLFSLRTQARA